MKKYSRGFVLILKNICLIKKNLITYLIPNYKYWNKLAAIIVLSLISNFSYGKITIDGIVSTPSTSASVKTDPYLVSIEGDLNNKLNVESGHTPSMVRIGTMPGPTNLIQLDNYGEIGVNHVNSGILNGFDNYSASIGTINNHLYGKITNIRSKNSSSITTLNNSGEIGIKDESDTGIFNGDGAYGVLTQGKIEIINNNSGGVITLVDNDFKSAIGTIHNNLGAQIIDINNNGSSSIGTLDNSGKIGVEGEDDTGIKNGVGYHDGENNRINRINNNSGGIITSIINKYSSSISTIKNMLGAKIGEIINKENGFIGTLDNSGEISNGIVNGAEYPFIGEKSSGEIGIINNNSEVRLDTLENVSKSTIGVINNKSNIYDLRNAYSSFIREINNYGPSEISVFWNTDSSSIKTLNNSGIIGKESSLYFGIKNSSSQIDKINNMSSGFIASIQNSQKSDIRSINNDFGAQIILVKNYSSSSIGTLDNSGQIKKIFNGDGEFGNLTQGTIERISNISGGVITLVDNNFKSTIGVINNDSGAKTTQILNNGSSSIGTLNNSGLIGIKDDSDTGIFNGFIETSGTIDKINNSSGGVITSINNSFKSTIGTLNNLASSNIDLISNSSGSEITTIKNYGSSSIATLDNSGKIGIEEDPYQGILNGDSSTAGKIATINNSSGGVITYIVNKSSSSIATINNYFGAEITNIRNYGSSSIITLDNLGGIDDISNGIYNTSGKIERINNRSGGVITSINNSSQSTIGSINNDSGAHLDWVENYGSSSIATLDNSEQIININNGLDNTSGKIDSINNSSGGAITSIDNNFKSSIGTIHNNSNSEITFINNKDSSSIATLDNSGKIDYIFNDPAGTIGAINNIYGGIIESIENNFISTIGIINNYSGSEITKINNYGSSSIATLDNSGKIGVAEDPNYGILNGYSNTSGKIDTINNRSGGVITSINNNFKSTIGTLNNLASSNIGIINNDSGAQITRLNNYGLSSIATLDNSGKIADIYNGFGNTSGKIDVINNSSAGVITSINNNFKSTIDVLNNLNSSTIGTLNNLALSKISMISNNSGSEINYINNYSASTIGILNNSGIVTGNILNGYNGTFGKIDVINNRLGGVITRLTNGELGSIGTINNLGQSEIGLLQNSGSISTTEGTAITTEGELTLINTGVIEGKDYAINSVGTLNLTQNAGNIKGGIKISGKKVNSIKILGGEVNGDIIFNSSGFNIYEQGNSKVTGNIYLVSGRNNKSTLSNATIDGTFTFKGKLTLNGQSEITDFDLKGGSTLFLGALPEKGEAYISASDATIGSGSIIKVTKPSDFGVNVAVNIIKSDNTFKFNFNNLSSESPFSLFNISSASGTNFLTITKTSASVMRVSRADKNMIDFLYAAKDQLQDNPELEDGLAVVPADKQADALTTLLSTTSSIDSKGALIAARNATKNIKQHLNANSIGFNNNTGISTGDTNKGISLWAQAFASNTKQKDLGLIEGYSLNNYGFSLGYENGYDHNYLSDNDLLGAAFSYSDTNINLSDLGSSKVDITSYQGAIYYSHKLAKSYNNLFKNIYFNLLGSYSYNKNRSTREIVVGSFKKSAKADFISHEFGLYSELGFNKRLNETWTISPSASLSYAHLRTPTYSETGAGNLNLTVSQKGINSLILGLGMTAQKELQLFEENKDENVSDLILELRAKVTDELLDDCFVTSSHFKGGNQFITEGAKAKRMGGELGIGIISLNASKNLELRADYNFKYKESNKTSNIYFTAKYKF